MTLGHIHRTIVGIVLAAAMPVFGTPARAGDAPSSPETQARGLADKVLTGATGSGEDSLDTWTRSTIERALERAGAAARDAAAGSGTAARPLAAERQATRIAGRIGGRPGSAEILIFMSLSVPQASWTQWARDAVRAGAPLVLRGVGDGGLRRTVKAVGERLDGHKAGVAIDPRLFRLFGVERVPAVVAVPGGVPPCRSRGCAEDPAPPHDVVTGNIGLRAALEALAVEGDAGRAVAKAALPAVAGDGR